LQHINICRLLLFIIIFCDVTQLRLVVSYWCSSTTYWSHLEGQAVQDMSLNNHQSALCTISGKQKSHSEHGRSLKLWIMVTTVIFQASNLYSYVFSRMRTQLNSQKACLFKNYIIMDDWQCCYTRDRRSYVCCTKVGKKYISFGKLVATKESIMLQLRRHTNWGHNKWLQLWL
jgi:hypothetical protein